MTVKPDVDHCEERQSTTVTYDVPGTDLICLATPAELCRASRLKGLHWQPDTKDRFETKRLSVVLAHLAGQGGGHKKTAASGAGGLDGWERKLAHIDKPVSHNLGYRGSVTGAPPALGLRIWGL